MQQYIYAMKKFEFLLFCMIATIVVNAQTSISGKVLNDKGESMIGANVYILNSYDGGMVDIDGYFSFNTMERDTQTLIVSYIGHEEFSLRSSVIKMHDLNITLREKSEILEVVEISAGSFKTGDGGKSEVMNAIDIVTTAGEAGDFISALKTLPGTQNASNDGRLHVRGGDAEETQVFLDGMRVFTPYLSTASNTASRARLSPFLFKGMSFSTGAYSSQFGDALSSVLELNTLDKEDQNKIDIGMMSLGASLGMTRIGKIKSFSLNSSYINLGLMNLINGARDDYNKPFNQAGGEAVYRHETKHGLWKTYAGASHSRFDVNQYDWPNDQEVRHFLKNNNVYVNSTFKGQLGKNTFSQYGMSYTFDGTNQIYNDFIFKNNLHAFHVVANFKNYFGKVAILKYGVDQVGVFNHSSQALTDSSYTDHAKQLLSGVFLETTIRPAQRLSFEFGLRGEYAHQYRKYNISLRLKVAYKLQKGHLIAAAFGLYHQQSPLQMESGLGRDGNFQQAWQAILNYSYEGKGRILRTELFYKKYQHLLKYNSTDLEDINGFNYDGSGYARGIDLFWKDRKSIKNLQYWISYSYIDAKKDYKDHPGLARPLGTADHNLSIVAKYWVPVLRSQIGGSYSFASGNFYDNPNTSTFRDEKTKAYHNLSLNWSFLVNQQMILFASVGNVLGINNEFGYEYKNELNADDVFEGRAINAASKRSFFLGFFWTISDNKMDNQLDNL